MRERPGEKEGERGEVSSACIFKTNRFIILLSPQVSCHKQENAYDSLTQGHTLHAITQVCIHAQTWSFSHTHRLTRQQNNVLFSAAFSSSLSPEGFVQSGSLTQLFHYLDGVQEMERIRREGKRSSLLKQYKTGSGIQECLQVPQGGNTMDSFVSASISGAGVCMCVWESVSEQRRVWKDRDGVNHVEWQWEDFRVNLRVDNSYFYLASGRHWLTTLLVAISRLLRVCACSGVRTITGDVFVNPYA